jgi:serine/threonine-protein kinase
MTTAFASTGDYLATLSASGLVRMEDLESSATFTEESPHWSPRQLADFLVAEGLLTRFQANYLLEGRLADLTLASYTLTDILGTGAMGTAYKAHSAKDQGAYVVKVVPRRNVVGLKSIEDKVQALKQIRHPRVSALVSVGASGDRVYLVWPYVEGGQKLSDVLGADGRLPPRQAAQIALQIASGLQPYHDQGLFHGLLKTSDVLIGSDRRVRLLDFGVGFLLTCDRGKAVLDTMTNGKTLAKGLDTASPEAILDSLARSPAGDQYSLGCILYRCLTGRYPFPYNNPVQKMVAHQEELPTPVRELCPQTPPALAAVVERLMEKAPENRYETMGEAVKELQAISSNARLFVTVTPRAERNKASAAKPAPAAARPEPAGKAAEPKRPSGRPLGAVAMTLAGLALGAVLGLLAWWRMHG